MLLLAPEDEKYYENYLDLFLHPGWKQFVTEAQDLLDSYVIEDIKDDLDLSFVKGQRSSLLNITRFETGIKNAFDMESNDD
jgi:predicted ATP-binding protein involved in virulence